MPDESSIAPNSPSGFRRLKIRVGLIFTLIAILLIVRLIWGSVAAHRLDRALATLRATGAPLTPQDLYPQTDPDPQQNAVTLFQQAVAAQNTTAYSPSSSNLSYKGYPPYPPAWHQLANAAVAANSQTLKLADDARALPKFYWNVPITSPLMPPVMSLNKTRELANLLGDSAEHAQLHGDDLLAIERTLDTLYLAQAVDHQNALISHFVSIGVNAIAISHMQVMAPSLKIPADEEQSPLRKDIRLLITQCTDDARFAESFNRAIIAERVYQIHNTHFIEKPIWIVRPAYDLDLVRMLMLDDLLLQASAQPSLVAARAMLPPEPPSMSAAGRFAGMERNPPRFSRPMSEILFSTPIRLLQSDMRERMASHLLAVSLAAQFYRADHHNQWPASLANVVPTYLKEVPTDPLGPPGATIHYLLLKHALPDGRDRPLVYSVGPNGIDDTAAGHPIPAEPSFGWNSYRGSSPDDQFCDLERWTPPPPPPPTTQSNNSTP